jgi:hypothetical protein
MLAPDEVRAVPSFAGLSDADVDRLVRTSADILLRSGEYAVHEGGERALYAVFSGRVEVVKLFDGVERTLGRRLPGRRHLSAMVDRRKHRLPLGRAIAPGPLDLAAQGSRARARLATEDQHPHARRGSQHPVALGWQPAEGAVRPVLLLTMLNTIGVSAGVRLLLTGLVIIAVIAVAGGQRAPH